MSTPTADVVVTGLGATTPLGGDVASTWEALLAGRSGVSRITDDWAKDFSAQLVARLSTEPAEVLDRVRIRRLDRSQQVAVIAAEEAWRDAAGADSGVAPERIAVVFGTGIGGAVTLLDQDDILEAKGPKRVSPFTIPMLMPNGPAAAVGLAVGAKAGVHAPVSACASGAEAIRWGLDLLRLGRADMVVVGGTEACVHPLPMAGFSAMRAMSTRNHEPERASRPFDKGRDGFVLGEGAAALVLERADAAKARGARIHARLAGAGGTADGYDLVAPHPEGEGAGRAIAAAIRDAGLTPADIGHVNAHATSTPIGDTAEASAIHDAIGDHTLVTATKSQTGHLLGAAGALESVFSILALREQIVPATANLDDPDDNAAVQALDIVRREPRKATFSAALNDSFGFGGHNMALVFTTA
ncbi:beta-ketoacyl-[acyl-carrier-protein] synthase family protein [Modestobacter sp. VKM Ac-2979]|uniref:beta-ketoacyl-[acyl-carrier-protein] synthase family protein n=1 Tax=unclassified Modestobacter TaxID=2643866 RepID=UPI0022AB5EA6|nr:MULTISPECIES: beta-ketoacyl-[acyl-carrier-protein] synthase family protein [unclassified Modestobacter]MCZ2813115.1 beta-ketoacyl-[acyl-carrier-protein] synthase family protein [Modestobacter sp. VKM Ac-2979]MCZ2842856.1 beta-ketoacyl-[acyl-carrier-protein] synthase family protein [Modestobacter sp. VKM Ac-2980]